MANDDKSQEILKGRNKLKDLVNSIRGITDDIRSDTYYVPKVLGNSLADIRDGITKSIDAITNQNLSTSGRASLSSVYGRMISSNTVDLKDGDIKALQDVFNDPQVLSAAAAAYASNTYIRQFDAEIDMICRYMTKLEEAIGIKKDMVLCADQFNKDFLKIQDSSSIQDDAFFNSEIKIIKNKYDLELLMDTAVYKSAKYGEDFIYIVPYKKALEQLLKRRQDREFNGRVVKESVEIEIEVVAEHVVDAETNTKKETTKTINTGIVVEFNDDFALTKDIKSAAKAYEQLSVISEQSINEDVDFAIYMDKEKDALFLKEDNTELAGQILKRFKSKIIPDDTIPDEAPDRKYPKVSTTVDGTTDIKKKDDIKLSRIPGCLVKHLDRDKVHPVYIEDICMGYYYIEVLNEDQMNFNTTANAGYNFNSMVGDTLQRYQQQGSFMSYTSNAAIAKDSINNDELLKKTAAAIAKKIDAKFINNNQDLAKEIYMILKYDDTFVNGEAKKINVTFIPPGDIVHTFFRQNEKTHRGISLLEQAMIPAKIAISLNMCNAIGMLTRGMDKRVYYVKQQVETNISKTLLSAINQIKKGNFGVRNLENLMGTLNITGMYNDYFIPRSANGESPIDFEILEGQKIDPNNEFIEKFEEFAVGTTGIPMELINSRMSVDYATQLTMTNAKHVRIIYKDQNTWQRFAGKIITKIFNAEFNKTSVLTVLFPPPLYLSLTNNSQLVQNTVQFAQSIIELEAKKKAIPDEVVQAAVADYSRVALGTYLDFNLIDETLTNALLEYKKNTTGNEE